MTVPRPILIAGPTASGKSALALMLAEHYGGVVINADSMQVYRDLSVLTARPDAADEALFDKALRAAGVQLVRLSPLHTYTVPGLVTVLDLADPD